MAVIRFFFVDVFADRPLTGNPLAVVPDADDLTEEQMRAIASEFNQSETTFLVESTHPHVSRRLRSFTPIGAEVDGAGHNALGAWLCLDEQGLAGTGLSTQLTQEIGAELLAVGVIRRPDEAVRVVMDQGPLRFGAQVAADERLAGALTLSVTDLAGPARTISTGVAHLHVPLTGRPAVDRAIFFNPTVGIVEDPATGTAAGPLAAASSSGRWFRPAGRSTWNRGAASEDRAGSGWMSSATGFDSPGPVSSAVAANYGCADLLRSRHRPIWSIASVTGELGRAPLARH